MTESNIRDIGGELCAQGFPVVAIMPGEKRPIGAGWQDNPLAMEDCWVYNPPEAGVGILCGYGKMPIIGIDADIEGDAELAAKVFDAWGHISPAVFVNPKRIGKPPKFLIVARTAQPIRKMTSAWFEKDGRRIRVEILGKGQQFVAYHTHPETGKPYDWSESLLFGNLYTMTPDLIEPVSVDELRLLLDKFEELAAEAGYTRVGTGSTAAEPAKATRFEDMTPETPPLGLSTEKALSMIETAELDVDDYDTWLHVGMALHHEYAGRREGRDAWDRWSQSGSTYQGPAEIEAKWESFGRNAGAKITMRWVQAKWRESAAGLSKEYNERGLVARVVVAFSSTLRYLADEGVWAYYNGQYWETRDDVGLRVLIANFIDRAFNREVAEIKNEDEKAVAFKYAVKCRAQYSRVIASVANGVKAQPGFYTTSKELRTNPRYISVGNGTLDCETMTLVPALPEYHVRQHLDLPYFPDAPAPHWRKAVLDMMDGNEEMATYLQKLVGCALLGCQTEEMMVFLVGGGCNGKTLFLSTIRKALGCYAKSIPAGMLTISGRQNAVNTEAATPTLLALKGVRFAYCSETPLNARLAESTVKALTGHDPVTARGLYARAPVTFDPTWLIFMATNHMPIIQGTDHGIWRRVRIVQFPVRFDSDPRYKIDNELGAKLEQELQGVLAWAAEGAMLYKRDGLQTPKSVEGEVARTRESFDLIGDWLEANCVRAAGARLAVADAWRDWQSYARTTGDGKIIDTQRVFTRILQERFPLRKSNGRNHACGLRLKTAEELEAEEREQEQEAEALQRKRLEEEIDALI